MDKRQDIEDYSHELTDDRACYFAPSGVDVVV